MRERKEDIHSVGEFITEYTSHMMGCGIHTSRVIRSVKRIGESFGYVVKISAFHRSFILTLYDKDSHESVNEVVEITPLPISFEHNSELSALSWETYDKQLSLDALRCQYQKIISAPSIHPLFVLLLVSFANASFCRLFGGDWSSMGIVFSSTMVGFFLKQQLTTAGINHFIVFIISAFVASLCASTSVIFENITSEIALATSVLFLVPGVPLINGVIDIVEGHILTGFARLAQAALLIICLAIGLGFTILIVKDSLI
ncbi:threonine/serine ThrE exporter family protein [Proteiniphilum sp. UBA5384]|uniref:threonine/serine ThrE exporter family protein n=1 Tax=Proteiniphilum sp. UBA5384 TaxID=1947279 RepID=UPI0025D0EFE9|nr:threonine/serine exporter family protein [Proteiniphilum sp. UBA5384]